MCWNADLIFDLEYLGHDLTINVSADILLVSIGVTPTADSGNCKVTHAVKSLI